MAKSTMAAIPTRSEAKSNGAAWRSAIFITTHE